MIEEWHDIPGYSGYQASTEGRIRSVDRLVYFAASERAAAYSRITPGRILRPAKHVKTDHLMVMLGRKNNIDVHRAVALAFHGPCPLDMETLHLDETPSNNRPSNLRYGTKGENVAMSWASGRRIVHPNFIGARWR